ncbi:MAG: Xaa-Pro peptidase family protein [Acidobacteriaceae bacterium]
MLSRRRFLVTAAATAPALALHAQHKPAPVEATLPTPILALTDRRKGIVPITVSERESRLDRARELMKQSRIDAIVITTGSSLQYFIAARWGQSERLFAYVLPAAAAPFVVCPYFERDRLNELLAAFPERETTLSFLWQENADPFDLLRKGLAESGLATGTLGIEEHTQFAFANAIARACPAMKIVSANPVTAGCRSRKSPAEIALLRLANAITIDVYRAAYLSCGPGDTNRYFSDIVVAGYARCGVHGDASCQVGPNSAVPHGTLLPQTIREHEIVLIDDGCTVEGYTSDISRSFVYGTPTVFQREIFQYVHNAQSAALAAARPGVEMQSVDAAARAVIAAAGYGPAFTYFTHRVGHGIGLDMHEWPYLVDGNTEKLAPGMVFSDEPGIYLPGKFGVRLEDDMLITASGAELLTPQSPSLEHPFGPATKPAA